MTKQLREGRWKFGRAEDDPMVQAALKELRDPSDIYVIECPDCGSTSYWNQGQHARCYVCKVDLSDLTDEAITLADYWDVEPYPCDDTRQGW